MLVIGLLSLDAFSQKSKDSLQPYFPLDKDKLESITEPPLKIDGGCSFFAFSDFPLGLKNNILIISANKMAFIKYNGVFIYFKRVERKEVKKGYIDKYFNKDYWMILKINNTQMVSKNSSIRIGTLEFINKKGHIVFAVHGKVEEIDKYNYPLLIKYP